MLLNNWNKACQYFITVWAYYIHVVSERCSVYRRLYLNEIILGYPYVDLCFDYVMWRVGVTEKEQSKQESILNKSCVWIRWRWEKVRVSGDKETDEKLFFVTDFSWGVSDRFTSCNPNFETESFKMERDGWNHLISNLWKTGSNDWFIAS